MDIDIDKDIDKGIGIDTSIDVSCLVVDNNTSICIGVGKV